MKINVDEWEEFELGKLFNIKKGKRLTSDDQTEGDTPYIGAIDSNNGVANFIGQSAIHSGNTISLSYNGSVGEAFYQPKSFWATDDVNVLYFKEKNNAIFNRYIAMFICTVLRQEQYRFSYGRKWILDSMKTTIIKLPAKAGSPDWGFMESYIKSLHYKPLSTSNKSGHSISYVLSTWKPFTVNELFQVKYGINMELNTCILAENNDIDAVNFVARTESNNGVTARVKQVEGKTPQPAGLITCAGGGSVLSTFLQTEPFYSGRDLYLLIPKHPMSKWAKLFCITVLKANKYRYSYGRQANVTLPELELMLPADADGKPDYAFMENYMKSLPYGDRI